MVAERRHCLARLAHGLAANVPAIAPLQREVLQEDDAELVGGGVQGVDGDVRLHAEGVEAGRHGTLDVAADERRAGVGETRTRRDEVGPLEEQPLAVDREHPVVEGDLAQAGAA